MGANRGGVDAVVAAFRHRLGERDGHALPDARGAPSSEAPVDRVPVAVLLRHVAPWRAAAQPPQDTVDNVAVISGGRPLPRLPASRSTGNKPFKTRHSASVRSPRLTTAPSRIRSLESTRDSGVNHFVDAA